MVCSSGRLSGRVALGNAYLDSKVAELAVLVLHHELGAPELVQVHLRRRTLSCCLTTCARGCGEARVLTSS